MITIENLKHFTAVVENQGVLRAGEKLFISASSLSRSVQQIEAELGKALFDRVGRSMSLNQEGRRFYEKARDLIQTFSLLLHDENPGGDLRGHYRIGASHFLCEKLVAGLVTKLTKRFTKATLEIYSLDSHVLVKKLLEGELDLGFSFSPQGPEAIEQIKVQEGQLRLCAGKNHPLMGKPFSVVKKELSSYPAIIHRPHDSIDRCDNHPMFGKFGIKPDIQVYWDSDYLALSLMAQGDYWSMLPEYVLEGRRDVVAFKHPPEWKAPYEIDLLWNKRKSVAELRESVLSLLRNRE